MEEPIWPAIDGDLTITQPLGVRVPPYLGFGGATPLMETPIAAELMHILADEPEPEEPADDGHVCDQQCDSVQVTA